MNSDLQQKYENMGTLNEERFKPVIKSIFGNVLKTENKYARIDFYGKDFILELKSRNCKSTDFSSTIITFNKIEKGFEILKTKPDFKVYFGFAFLDGFYTFELNSNTYEANGGDSRKKIAGTNKRGWDHYKEHLYIDIKNLKKISDIGSIVPEGILPVGNGNKREFKSSIPDNICFLKLLKNN